MTAIKQHTENALADIRKKTGATDFSARTSWFPDFIIRRIHFRRVFVFWVIAFASLCFIQSALENQLWAASRSIQATVTIDPGQVIGRLDSRLFGHNLQWTQNGEDLLNPGDDAMDFNLKALTAIKRLPVSTIRFPGGLLSSRYVWQQGLGPLASRQDGPNYLGAPEKMRFGTNEFVQLLKILGAGGMITVNPKRPASDAAEWLSYIKNLGGRVDYWEFGNESFLPQDPSYMPVDEYVTKFREFHRALKAINPQIKVGALIEGSLISVEWGKFVAPELNIWNEKVIQGTSGTADFYATHLYSPFDSDPNQQNTLMTLAAGPTAMAANIVLLQKLIKEHSPLAELWITEFNIGMKTPEDAWKYGPSLAQAGYVASMMLVFARNGVTGANYWSLIGNHNFGLIKTANDGTERPAALVYRLLAPLANTQAVATTVGANTLTYKPIGNVVSGLNPKVLEAQAFLGSEALHLVLINRLPNEVLTVKLVLPRQPALNPKAGGLITLQGPDAMANNESGPTVVLKNAPFSNQVNLPPGAVCRVWAPLAK